MSLFGRFKKLDSSLQRGLDNGFARVFGGEVVPTEIDEVLKQYAEESVMTDAQGQRLAPSHFQILVSTRDYASLTESRPRLAEEMGDRLSRFIRNQGWRTNEPVKVNLAPHDGLHSGQMRADARFDVPRTNDIPGGNVAIGEANATEQGGVNPFRNPDGGYQDSYPQAAPHEGHPEWPYSQSEERSLVSQDYDAYNPNDNHSNDANASDATGANGASKSLGDLVSPAGAAGLGGAAAVHHAAPDFARNQQAEQYEETSEPEPSRESEQYEQHEQQEPQRSQNQGDSAVHYGQNQHNQQAGDSFERPASYPGTEVIVQSTPAPVRGGVGADGNERELKVTLTLHDGSDRTYELRKGSNIIGRGNGVDLRIPDTGVSRQHADITWDGYDAVLTDLQSTNGTSVNGTPIENWLLASGDVISLGHSEIGVEFH